MIELTIVRCRLRARGDQRWIALGCSMGERERSLQVIGGISIPLLFLSRFAFPIESISEPLIWLSHLLPSTPSVQGFIKLNPMGATWTEVKPQVINLSLLGFLYIAVAWYAVLRRARPQLCVQSKLEHGSQSPHAVITASTGTSASFGPTREISRSVSLARAAPNDAGDNRAQRVS